MSEIQNFISRLGFEKEYYKDFKSLTNAIEKSYIYKSIKQEEFFLKNIALCFNKRTNEGLLDSNSLQNLDANYTSRVNPHSLQRLVEKPYLYDYINLEDFKHNKSTSFLENKDALYSYKKLAKVKYLDFKNQHKTPVMLTFTLNKQYRKYVKESRNIDSTLGIFKNLKLISEEANLEELVEKSYEKLNNTYREFYKYFKTLNMRSEENDKLDFILIFEPHKSLTIHLHVLFYCNQIQSENLCKAWNNYLKPLSKDERKGQNFKIIDTNRAKASTYLSKYLVKEYNTDKEDNNSFFQKFRRYFSRYKLFRTSNFYTTTQAKIDKMYSFMQKEYPDILERLKSTGIPLYIILEELEQEGLFSFTITKKKEHKYDKTLIKKYFNKYKNTVPIKTLKAKIENSLDKFVKNESRSYIETALFRPNQDKLYVIINKYQIDTKNLENLHHKSDITFYEKGMYQIQSYPLQKILNIIRSVM